MGVKPESTCYIETNRTNNKINLSSHKNDDGILDSFLNAKQNDSIIDGN
jgi:hypothetical protein